MPACGRRSGIGDLTTTYSFDGEDVLISARVENNHPDEPLNVVGFRGLTFHFGRPPTRPDDGATHHLFPGQWVAALPSGRLVENRRQLCRGRCDRRRPVALENRLDAHAVALGLRRLESGQTRTSARSESDLFCRQRRSRRAERGRSISSCASARNLDWKHLLEPYREHFQATFGPVRYKADDRWIATDYLNHSPGAIGPDEPLRLSRRRAAVRYGRRNSKSFATPSIPVLKRDNGQGVIVWGQGGENPRGAMYRPDFDVLPPEVEANWPTLAERFHRGGAQIGRLHPPGRHRGPARLEIGRDHRDQRRRSGPSRNALAPLSNHDEARLHAVLSRQLRLRSGACEADELFARAIRTDILTFCEHQCDAIMPYSGGYSETTYRPREPGQSPQYDLWSGSENWKIYQWLAPGSQMASRFMQEIPKNPAWKESPDAFFYRNRITPLVPTNDLFRGDELLKLQSKALDAREVWRQ